MRPTSSLIPKTRTSMDRWEGKVAVVTGASAGIGAAISESLVKAGVLVVGLARRLEKLETLSESLTESKGKFYSRQCDVANEKDLIDAFKWVKTELGGVDILVSNAGVSTHSRIIDDDIQSFRKILDVNVLAAAVAVREAVASMKSRDVEGHIITINSVLGHQSPGANFQRSLYSPSKHALRVLADTVRKELAVEPNNKIKITSISPGLVKTGMSQASGGSASMYDLYPHIVPEEVVNAVLYVLGTPPKVLVTELIIRAIAEDF